MAASRFNRNTPRRAASRLTSCGAEDPSGDREARPRRVPAREGSRFVIRVDREDAVAVVTVDRQDALNALDVSTLTQLRDELRSLGDEDGVRVVILTGAGERAFVAGADIKYMSGL